MAPTVRRRLFKRVVFWQPATGTIIDLSTRYVLPLEGPSEQEEYASLTTGSKRPVRRTNSVQVPLTHHEAADISTVLHRFQCPMKAVFVGGPKADCWTWLEPTRLQVRDPAVESGLQAEKVIDFETDVFYPAVWEGMGLLSGVPWRGTTEQQRNGNSVLRNEGNARPGYEGPLWSVPTGASVDMSGNASGIDSGNPAKIELEFPVWGATLRIDDEVNNLTGTLEPYDWDGNSLSGANQQITVPRKTWTIQATVEGADTVPDIEVVFTGEGYGVLEGAPSPDCSRVSDPLWSNTELVLTDTRS